MIANRRLPAAVRASTLARALVLLALAALPASADVEQRWEYQQKSPEDGYPAAVYHSYDGKSVIFRARCDIMAGEFVLIYFGDGEVELDETGYLILPAPGGDFELTTRFVDGVLEGRAAARSPELRAWAAAANHEIVAPDSMGEPWFVGKAEPLKRILDSCG